MKICISCSAKHEHPRSELCLSCQRKRNHDLYRKRIKDPEAHPKLTPEERIKIRLAKQTEYYRKKRGLPADYIPSYRSPVIKKCETCGEEHDRPRSNICPSCQKKVTAKKNYEWQKKARKKDPALFKERVKKSQSKNPELYRKLQRQNYIKRFNLPEDHVFRERKKAGEGSISSQGYRRIPMPLHPNVQSNGQILEHVFIMSQHLGRPLYKGETVHHINGDRLDNRIENLELWHRSHPPGQRVEEKIAWCKEFLKQYGYEVTLCERVSPANRLSLPQEP